jgi:hypothetical protein
VQVATFFFATHFQITSVEKIDGVTVANARPLDPKVPLAQPNFNTKHGTIPIGSLGLQLGTFAIIEARPYDKPIMLESPFFVEVVNGKKMDPPRILTIRDARIAGDGHVTLHGFEVGEWSGEPSLPESEVPASATKPQQPFHFGESFIVTSQPGTGGR